MAEPPEQAVRSVEVFFDDSFRWCVRTFSGPSRTGIVGARFSTATDDMLGVAALSTVPTLLAHDGYATSGDWHIDEDNRTAWINTAQAGDLHPDGQPGPDSVDAIFDAETRWERFGIGRQTRRT